MVGLDDEEVGAISLEVNGEGRGSVEGVEVVEVDGGLAVGARGELGGSRCGGERDEDVTFDGGREDGEATVVDVLFWGETGKCRRAKTRRSMGKKCGVMS